MYVCLCYNDNDTIDLVNIKIITFIVIKNKWQKVSKKSNKELFLNKAKLISFKLSF